jgi:hypothetical protein
MYANVRPITPLSVSVPGERPEHDKKSAELLDFVVTAKPLICLAFDNMEVGGCACGKIIASAKQRTHHPHGSSVSFFVSR